MLVNLVETETGYNIRKRDRRREVTYARALYCKLAREIIQDEERYSYSKIGKAIGKDHATILHNVNVIFPFAMKEDSFNFLYHCIKILIKNDNFNKDDFEERKDTIKDLQKGIATRDKEIVQLKRDNLRFNSLVDGLTLEERNDLYEKISLTVKVIKAHRGAYAEAEA